MKKEGKRKPEPSSKHPVQRFKTSVEHKSTFQRKRLVGNRRACVLPNPLPETARKILAVLGSEGVAEQAMVAAKVVKSDVSYWVKRFKEAGALVLRQTQVPNSSGPVGKQPDYKPGSPHYYDLTPYGSKLVAGGDAVLHYPILYEDRPLIFSVKEREKKAIPWKPLGDVRYWRKFGVMLGGVTVELHDKCGPNHDQANVMIHPGHIKGFNVDELLSDSAAIVERVKNLLEITYGIVLSEKGELPKNRETKEAIRPRFRVYHPDVKEWVKAGAVDIPGYGAVDESPEYSKSGIRDPLSNQPHAEFENSKDASLLASMPSFYGSDPGKQDLIDGLTGPALLRETHRIVKVLVCRIDSLTVEVNKAKSVEAQVGAVMVEFKRLADAMSKLENLEKLPEITQSLRNIAGVLNKLADLEDSQAKPAEAPKKDGGKDYVS